MAFRALLPALRVAGGKKSSSHTKSKSKKRKPKNNKGTKSH